MSRINTNVPSLLAQNRLAAANSDLNTRLERLSTGLRINSGGDDPSGLIVSERLRSEISSIGQAVENAERATNVIGTTEAALSEINDLLISIKGLTIEAANTGAFSPEEVRANQLEIDSAVESITRIANTTSFAGLKLLNGHLDFVVSGQDSTQVTDIRVNNANFGLDADLPVTVEVVASAQRGGLFLSGNLPGAAGELLSSVTLELQGNTGAQVFNFVSGTPLSAVADAVNQVRDATGVSARLVSAANPTSGLVFESIEYGDEAFVSVTTLDGGDFFRTYEPETNAAVSRDLGRDVTALVNGHLATGDGLDVVLDTPTLTLDITLASGQSQLLSAPFDFTVTGGGALFQLGRNVNSLEQVGFGIPSVTAAHLGSQRLGFLASITTGGPNSLVIGNPRGASDIIDEAVTQISTIRGRLGAFQRNTLETTIRSQQVAVENLTEAESLVRDADFAAETAALTRAQVMQQAGTQTLSLANSNAEAVLALLQ